MIRSVSRTATGLDAFDKAVGKATLWVRDLCREMGWEDRHRAYLGLRAVLHSLRNRLTPQEAPHLAAEMPLLIRGMYYEGWNPSKTPTRERTKGDFLDRVRGHLPRTARDSIDAEPLTRAVFRILAQHISPGEIDDVKKMLPEELRAFWPGAPLERQAG